MEADRTMFSALQKDILTHIAMNASESQTNASLASALQKDETTTFTSIKSLVDKNLLSLSEPRDRNRRFLRLTQKGYNYARYYCDVQLATTLKNHPKIDSSLDLEAYESFRKALSNEIMDIFEKTLAKFLIDNDLFDLDGTSYLDKSKGTRYHHYWIPILIEITHKVVDYVISKSSRPDSFSRQELDKYFRDTKLQKWLDFAESIASVQKARSPKEVKADLREVIEVRINPH